MFTSVLSNFVADFANTMYNKALHISWNERGHMEDMVVSVTHERMVILPAEELCYRLKSE